MDLTLTLLLQPKNLYISTTESALNDYFFFSSTKLLKKIVPKGIPEAEGVIEASGVSFGESAAGEVAGGIVEPVGELAAA